MSGRRWKSRVHGVALALMLALGVASCGGGGGGAPATSSVPAPSATAPTLTQQPAALSAVEGTSASFSVGASGSAPLTYQWQRNGQDIPGATGATLTVDHVVAGDTGAQFRVVVGNAAGSVTSASVVLSVTPAAMAPVDIDVQPASVAAMEGAIATLQVHATGSGALHYQWYRAGQLIAGATGASLAVGPLRFGDDVDYTVQVSDAASVVLKRTAAIRFVPAAAAKPISDCVDITAPGSYALTSDIGSASSTQTCLTVRGTQDVQLDCGNHKLYGPLTVQLVSHFSLKNCTIDSEWISIDASSWGSVANNSLASSRSASSIQVAYLKNSDHIVAAHNTIWGAFQDQYSDSSTVSDNQIFGSPQFTGSSGIISLVSKHARIFANTIDGRWNGQAAARGSFPFGLDDGIIVQDLSDVIVENNTIRNVWDAGIEWLGSVSDSIIRGNHIEKAGACAIGGWFSSSVWNVQFVRNDASDVQKLFYIVRLGGLRTSGSDPRATLPAETEVRFRDNVFDGNVLLPPFSGALGSVIPVFDRMGYVGDKSSLPDSAFNIGNNVFKNNDFGSGVPGPDFGAGPVVPGLVIDGGGNKCTKSRPDPYPLTCN